MCKWVSINGVKFAPKGIIMLQSDNDLPNFCHIEQIFVRNEQQLVRDHYTQIKFLIQHLRCLGIDESLNCYICQPHIPLRHSLVNHDDIIYFDCISCYEFEDNIFVPQKIDYSSVN